MKDVGKGNTGGGCTGVYYDVTREQLKFCSMILKSFFPTNLFSSIIEIKSCLIFSSNHCLVGP